MLMQNIIPGKVRDSDMEFNWDVLNENNSLLFDPMDIDQIAAAINSLYENKQLREKLSKGAIQTASKLTIDARVERILKYIKSRL